MLDQGYALFKPDVHRDRGDGTNRKARIIGLAIPGVTVTAR
jgi:hypothetical protein